MRGRDEAATRSAIDISLDCHAACETPLLRRLGCRTITDFVVIGRHVSIDPSFDTERERDRHALASPVTLTEDATYLLAK
jgi:hypothetical protein